MTDPARWREWVTVIFPAGLLFILPFPGTVAMRLLLLSITFVLAISMWRRAVPPAIPCKLPIALWAAVAIASIPLSFDPGYSLGEVKNEIGYSMMAFIAFYVLATDSKRVHRIGAGLAAGSIALLVPAFYLQSGQLRWNESAFVGGSGIFSTYLITTLPVFLTPLLSQRRHWLAALVVVAYLSVGYLAGQKIYFLVFALQIVLMIWLLNRAGAMRTSGKAIVGALVLGAVVLGTMFQQSLTRRAATDSPFRDNLVQDVRIRNWPKVVNRILEQPLVGKGFGRNAMSKAYPDLIPPESSEIWHAHNVFLNYGLSMGVPGMLALLILFACLLRKYWLLASAGSTLQRAAGIAGIAMVVGVITRNLTNDFFIRDMSLLFWSLNGLLLGLGHRLSAMPERRR